MKKPFLIIVFSLLLINGNASATEAPSNPVQQVTKMTHHISGLFDVKMSPQAAAENEEASIGRMLLDKQFHGDLEANSKGQMLAHMTSVKGSGGYVAMEKVVGTLQGRKGSFLLQHSGTMNRGEASLVLTVVPDSGTEELEGLSGSMTITVTDGKHFYGFDYSLPKK
ncbi:MAG TPA: DUF3224 domain-containing protein [Arenimonas sp.]|nr:DUF3224 domain-containing protein [Arenimonas sp.]